MIKKSWLDDYSGTPPEITDARARPKGSPLGFLEWFAAGLICGGAGFFLGAWFMIDLLAPVAP